MSTDPARRRPISWEQMKVHDLGVDAGVDPRIARKQRVREVAKHVVKQVLGSGFKVPMLPAAAQQALAIASDPNVSVKDIDDAVRADPVLTARVLAVANSAVYQMGVVKSVGSALQRLGTGTARDILYQAVAESHIFRGSAGRDLVREREHAVAVAHISRATCRMLGVDAEYAFVCGLLHDIGRTVLMQILQRCPPPDVDSCEFDDITRLAHAAVGAKVGEGWKLPASVIESVRRHHKYRDFAGDGSYSQIANVVAVADRIAEHHGYGRAVAEVDLHKDRCVFDLGLSPEMVMELVEKAGALQTGE